MDANSTAGTETAFLVELDEFSGPLDLLLNLIRQQEIEIWDIPIARVADQFLAVIGVLGLDDAAEYLEMAAQLLRIKIQMLLPRPIEDDDWEDPRAELVRRLMEYEQIKEVAHWMNSAATSQSDRFGRGWTPPEPEAPPRPVLVDIDIVIKAVEDVIAGLPQPILHRVLARPLDVEGARDRILNILKTADRLDFREIIGENPTVADVLSAFLALLELARQGTVKLVQQNAFEDFEINSETTDAAD